MERLGSILWRTWNNNDKKTLNNNDDDDLSSWEIINPNYNTPHDHDHDHDDHVLQQQQQHGLSLSTECNDIDRPRLEYDNVSRLVVGSHDDHTTNMHVSDELEPNPGPSSSSSALITHPFPKIDVICDPVCNRRLDHHEEEDQVHHESINYDDDDEEEEYDYDYDDDDSRWLTKQRMTKVGKKVNNGMMKKSNKLPRYFYNKFV